MTIKTSIIVFKFIFNYLIGKVWVVSIYVFCMAVCSFIKFTSVDLIEDFVPL